MLAGVRGCEVCLYISRPVGNAPADLRCFHCLQCRYVRLLHNPIAAVFSRSLMDSYSNAHACVGLKSGKARTSLQHRLPAETGREPGESRESNKTGVEQGDMQRKQLTGHASKRVYDWQSGMAHWGETQRYGSMGWPNGSAER